MSDSTRLLELQKSQQEHDRGHHRDIFSLSYPERMTHYVLHFSKYVGRLARDYADEKARKRQLEKTLADSFIVALASANTLNLDLHQELNDMTGGQAVSVAAWSKKLDPDDSSRAMGEVQEWLFQRMAVPTGRMSNALESLDHMESMTVRELLEEETVEIVSDLLIAGNRLSVDIGDVVEARWEEIEAESIL